MFVISYYRIILLDFSVFIYEKSYKLRGENLGKLTISWVPFKFGAQENHLELSQPQKSWNINCVYLQKMGDISPVGIRE